MLHRFAKTADNLGIKPNIAKERTAVMAGRHPIHFIHDCGSLFCCVSLNSAEYGKIVRIDIQSVWAAGWFCVWSHRWMVAHVSIHSGFCWKSHRLHAGLLLPQPPDPLHPP